MRKTPCIWGEVTLRARFPVANSRAACGSAGGCRELPDGSASAPVQSRGSNNGVCKSGGRPYSLQCRSFSGVWRCCK